MFSHGTNSREKVFYVRFITQVPRKPGGLEAVKRKRKIVVDSDDENDLVESRESCPEPARPRETTTPNDTHTDLLAVPISTFPKSVSIADLLKARKFTPRQPLTGDLKMHFRFGARIFNTASNLTSKWTACVPTFSGNLGYY